MHFLGFNVMPRRIPDFPDSFHSWNFLSSIGSGITLLSFGLLSDPLFIHFLAMRFSNRRNIIYNSLFLSYDLMIQFIVVSSFFLQDYISFIFFLDFFFVVFSFVIVVFFHLLAEFVDIFVASYINKSSFPILI